MTEIRAAEQWETSAAGPYCTILNTEHDVTIWALGHDRHPVVCDGNEHVIEAHVAAHPLAGKPCAPVVGGPA